MAAATQEEYFSYASGFLHAPLLSVVQLCFLSPLSLGRRPVMPPDGSRLFTLAFVGALALAVLPHISNAQSPKKTVGVGLEGSWSGGGSVTFASGAREQARCRAHYRRAGKSGYTVSATCATASGRASQTATLRQVGENRYSGGFYNSEYSISGVMYVVVRGSSQSVRLNSSSGSAALSLSRSR